MTDKKRNPAGVALFQMQFGLFMIRCDRIEAAQKAFDNAQTILADLEIRIDRALDHGVEGSLYEILMGEPE